jgi:hypothetical protein
MTGYSPALAALSQLRAIELVERLLARRPRIAPEMVVAMSRDTLITALLPPPRTLTRRRVTRRYPREALS